MRKALHYCAKHGRWVLVIGLLIGVIFPSLALALKPWLPEMVALLLFIAVLRIGPKEAVGTPKDWPGTLMIVGLFQVAVPLVLIALFKLFELTGPIAFAISIMASASAISGSANLTILTGHNAQSSLRVLVLGTALLPLTVLPTFWLLPELGTVSEIFAASGRLMLVIVFAGLAGSLLRVVALPNISQSDLKAIDGLSALAMALVVVGLMSAIGPAIVQNPQTLVITMAAAFAVNFGLQLLFYFLFSKIGDPEHRVGRAICAGNRNMALFLTALPVSLTDPILLFIGCYQFPMYLTPILLKRLYRP